MLVREGCRIGKIGGEMKHTLAVICLLVWISGCRTVGNKCDQMTCDSRDQSPLTLVAYDFLDLLSEGDTLKDGTFFVEDFPQNRIALSNWKGSIQIKFGDQDVSIRAGQVVDSFTGKPAKLIAFIVISANQEAAEVKATWISGESASAAYTYRLQCISGKWTVMERVLKEIS